MESTSFYCAKCEEETFSYVPCLYGDDELKCPKCKTVWIVTLTKKSEHPPDGWYFGLREKKLRELGYIE